VTARASVHHRDDSCGRDIGSIITRREVQAGEISLGRTLAFEHQEDPTRSLAFGLTHRRRHDVIAAARAVEQPRRTATRRPSRLAWLVHRQGRASTRNAVGRARSPAPCTHRPRHSRQALNTSRVQRAAPGEVAAASTADRAPERSRAAQPRRNSDLRSAKGPQENATWWPKDVEWWTPISPPRKSMSLSARRRSRARPHALSALGSTLSGCVGSDGCRNTVCVGCRSITARQHLQASTSIRWSPGGIHTASTRQHPAHGAHRRIDQAPWVCALQTVGPLVALARGRSCDSSCASGVGLAAAAIPRANITSAPCAGWRDR